MSWLDVQLNPVTIEEGGGGGGTTTAEDFVRPDLGATVDVDLVDATILAKFQMAKVGDALNYYVGNIVSNTVTFQNLDPANSRSGSVASGAAVAFGGNALALAATQVLPGQALVANTSNRLEATGHVPVENILAYGTPSVALDNGWAARIETAVADAVAAGRRLQFVPGVYGTKRPVFLTQSAIDIDAPSILAASDPNAAAVGPLYLSGTDWTGPGIVLGGETPEPTYIGPNADGMYGMILQADGGAAEPRCWNVGAFDVGSLQGLEAIALDIKVFYPAGGNTGGSYALFGWAEGVLPGVATYVFTCWTEGTDQLRAFLTTSSGGTHALLSVGTLTQNAWNDVRVSWDGAFLRMAINGAYETPVSCTGTIVSGPFTRAAVGFLPAAPWGASDDALVGPFGALAGMAVGDSRLSYGGTPVTRTTNYTPEARYTRDDSTTVTIHGISTLCTAFLINCDVANRSSQSAHGGHTGWLVAECNATRTGSLPRIPGNKLWISCGSHFLDYKANIKISNLLVHGGTAAIYAKACPYARLHNVNAHGYVQGAVLGLLSYFSIVDGPGGDYSAALNADQPGKFVGDFWGMGAFSEGVHVVGGHFGGGNFALCGSGVWVGAYVDVSGYYGVATSNATRVCTMVDLHCYNESNSAAIISLVLHVGTPMVTVIGGLIGTVGSAVPYMVQVFAGGPITYRGVAFAQFSGNPCFSFPYVPAQPVEYSGTWVTASSTLNDPALPGPINVATASGVSTVPTVSDANKTISDAQFYAGRKILIDDTDAHWSATRTVATPYNVEGDERIFWNKSGNAHSMTVGTTTIAPGAMQLMVNDGTTWEPAA
jgi:hypothetical protein